MAVCTTPGDGVGNLTFEFADRLPKTFPAGRMLRLTQNRSFTPEGIAMQDASASQPVAIDPVGILATEVLRDLYVAVAGREPAAVRSYRDEDALLLLLRFENDEQGDDDAQNEENEQVSPFLDTAFLAMPGMVASAVEARTGQRLAPGNLSVCADRGLAVFAFSALEETSELSSDEDIFRIDTDAMGASTAPALGLAS